MAISGRDLLTADSTHYRVHLQLHLQRNDDRTGMVGVFAICAGTFPTDFGGTHLIRWTATVLRRHVRCQINVCHLSLGIEMTIGPFQRSVRVTRTVFVLDRMRIRFHVWIVQHVPFHPV